MDIWLFDIIIMMFNIPNSKIRYLLKDHRNILKEQRVGNVTLLFG